MSKKIVKVLNGIAITGTAVGGASILGDANLVLAQEAEEALQTPAGEYTLNINNDVIEQLSPEAQAEVTEAQTQIQELETLITEAEEAQNVATTNIEGEDAAISQANSDISEIDGQIEANNIEISGLEIQVEEKNTEINGVDAQISANELEVDSVNSSLTTAQGELDAATSAQQAAQAELDAAQNTIDADQETINNKQQQFDESGYGNTGLSIIEESITGKLDLAKQQFAGKKTISAEDYKKYLRPVAEDLIKYELVQSGEVEYSNLGQVSIVYYKRSENGLSEYYNSHYCVRYVNTQGVLREKYFDYVTCDLNGKSMFTTDVNHDNTPELVENFGGINILEKIPTYSNLEGENTTDYIYFVKADYNNLSQAEKDLYHKNATFNKVTYYYANRTGWYVEEGETAKGTDHYTREQYTEDVNNRKNIPIEIQTLQDEIDTLSATVETKQQEVNSYNTTISERTAEVNNYTNTKNTLTTEHDGLVAAKQTLLNELSAITSTIQNLKDQITSLVTQKGQLNDEITQHNTNKTGYQEIYNAKDEEIAGYKVTIAALKEKIAGIIATLTDTDDDEGSAAPAAPAPSANASTSSVASVNVRTVQNVSASVSAPTAMAIDNVVTAPTAGVQVEENFEQQSPVVSNIRVQQATVEPISEVQPPLAVMDLEEPEDTVSPVTIGEQEVAKARIEGTAPEKNWNGTTLPFLGALAGILGIGKVSKDIKDKKDQNA